MAIGGAFLIWQPLTLQVTAPSAPQAIEFDNLKLGPSKTVFCCSSSLWKPMFAPDMGNLTKELGEKDQISEESKRLIAGYARPDLPDRPKLHGRIERGKVNFIVEKPC